MQMIDYVTREAWLAGRQNGIGASEVAILFGLAPAAWGSPYSLWAEKTGLLPRQELEGEWLKWGHKLEPVIAEEYVERTQRKLWSGGGPFAVAVDPECSSLFATPDRFVVDASDLPGTGVLQIKNIGWYMGHDWDEEIPPHIQCQIQTEMACTGTAWGSAAGLIGGNRFINCDLKRDDAFIAQVRSTVAWFWKLVVTKTPPPTDGSIATTQALKRLHPNDNGETVELPDAALEWLEEWEQAKANLLATEKQIKPIKEGAENKLREAIGAATFGVLPDGRRLTLKTTSRAGYVVGDTSFRQLRIESQKKGR